MVSSLWGRLKLRKNLSPRAWIPTPVALVLLMPVSSHKTTALPRKHWLGALQFTHTAISVWNVFTRLQSFADVQARGFARRPDCSYRSAPFFRTLSSPVEFGGHPVAFAPALSPTRIVALSSRQLTRQPWLFLPRLSRFVTSPSRGYANRPFRATDGRGTFTLRDSQPCRLLRFQDINTVAVCSIAFNEAVIASGGAPAWYWPARGRAGAG
jgi:hypothetical protein